MMDEINSSTTDDGTRLDLAILRWTDQSLAGHQMAHSSV
jgi:hypothetical protein